MRRWISESDANHFDSVEEDSLLQSRIVVKL